MAPLKLKENASYIEYSKLQTRPLGMEIYKTKPDTMEPIIVAGELFCRAKVSIQFEDEELCENKARFSSTGNLRNHVQGHKQYQLGKMRAGTLTSDEVREAGRWYKSVMQLHAHKSKVYDPEKEKSHSPELYHTPVKAAHGKAAHGKSAGAGGKLMNKPKVPRKKDGSIHKTQMRKEASVTKKLCNKCKENKAKSCPPSLRAPCEVWDKFEDKEEPEPEEEQHGEEGINNVLVINSGSEAANDDEEEEEEEAEATTNAANAAEEEAEGTGNGEAVQDNDEPEVDENGVIWYNRGTIS